LSQKRLANFLSSLQQVNWPKLNRQPPQIEAFQETLQKVRNHPVVGPLVGGSAKHERGKSDARLLGLEEGKKRIE
jgi:hypothetical protein